MGTPTQEEIFAAIRAADATSNNATATEADRAAARDDVIKLGQYLQHVSPPPPPLLPPASSPERQAGREFATSGGPQPFGFPVVPAIHQAAQGASFNFADELIGGANILTNPLHPVIKYKEGRDFSRGMSEQFSKEWPKSALLADVTGSLATTSPFGKALKAMSAGKEVGAFGQLGRASAVGATAGGLSGAGGAESISDVPFEVVKHGAFGAALSPVVQGIAAPVLGAVNMARQAIGGPAARELAQRRVAEAIARANQTAQQAKTFMGQQKFGGPEGEAVIADTSESTRNLLDTVATLPGKTSDAAANFLRRRRVETPERMDTAFNPLNPQGNRADATLDLLNRVQAQQAKPLYAAVDNVVVPITPQLENLFQTPAFRQAYAQAAKNAANRREPLPSLDDLQKMGPVGGLPVKVWDSIKKGFDDVIASKKVPNPSNEAQNTLRDTRDIKNEMVAEIDRLTGGAYKAARDAHAGPAALKTALEDGQSFWSMSAVEMKQVLAQMTASEREAFRMGANEALRTKAGSPSGQTELVNAWKDRNTREKLEQIFETPLDYRRAIGKLHGEEQLRKLYGTNTGSATARRLAGKEDMAAGIAEDIAPAAISPSPLSMWAAAKKVTSRMANPEPVRDEVGRILLQGGRRGREELARLEEIVKMYNERSAARAAVPGVLGGSLF